MTVFCNTLQWKLSIINGHRHALFSLESVSGSGLHIWYKQWSLLASFVKSRDTQTWVQDCTLIFKRCRWASGFVSNRKKNHEEQVLVLDLRTARNTMRSWFYSEVKAAVILIGSSCMTVPLWKTICDWIIKNSLMWQPMYNACLKRCPRRQHLCCLRRKQGNRERIILV